MKLRIPCFLFFLVLVFSCKKQELISTNTPSTFAAGDFILNEGTFNFGNASLDFYDFKKDSLYENVFETINHKKLGDVAQSVLINKKHILIVVNNSNKIEVLDRNTLKIVKTIEGLGSPRYAHWIDSSRVLVTELYNKKIHIVHIEKGIIEKSFDSYGWTERMMEKDNKIWIQVLKHPSEANGEYGFMIFDKTSQNMITTKLTDEPISFVLSDSHLWYLAKRKDGTYYLGGNHLTTFDVITNPIDLGSQAPSSLQIDNQDLYFLQGKKLWKADISLPNATLTMTMHIDLPNSSNLYSMSIHAGNQKIFITDAKDYVSKGDVHIYSLDGNLIKKIQAGIIPNQVVEVND